MNGGLITSNTSTSINGGGGVRIIEDSFFTMNGGEISGNKATATTSAGGVGIRSPGTFRMTGGTIYGNIAENNLDPSNALVNGGPAKSAEHGRFVGDVWQRVGYLTSTDSDITVDDGVLQ